MKFLHTGDLHIGKVVHEFSMIEEQRHVLKQMVEIAKTQNADAVVIAGDIYDRSIPSTEAVLLLNDFLTVLLEEKIKIIMIAGNHDSPERLQFAYKILEKQGLTISGRIENEKIKQVVMEDEYGKVEFTMLPFVKPAAFGQKNSHGAVAYLLKQIPDNQDIKTRRVCVTHFFVTENGREPELSDSETSVYVGGLDHVESGLFSEFDYVALGHIHKAQKIGGKEIYYSGSPLKYSFSEANLEKSINIVTLKEKGNIQVEKAVIKPLHDMRKIKGMLAQLISNEVVENVDCRDYIQATLLDEEELIDPIGTLRSVYPNICQIILQKNIGIEDKERKIQEQKLQKSKTIYELFDEFYQNVTGHEMDDVRKQTVLELIKEVEE